MRAGARAGEWCRRGFLADWLAPPCGRNRDDGAAACAACERDFNHILVDGLAQEAVDGVEDPAPCHAATPIAQQYARMHRGSGRTSPLLPGWRTSGKTRKLAHNVTFARSLDAAEIACIRARTSHTWTGLRTTLSMPASPCSVTVMTRCLSADSAAAFYASDLLRPQRQDRRVPPAPACRCRPATPAIADATIKGHFLTKTLLRSCRRGRALPLVVDALPAPFHLDLGWCPAWNPATGNVVLALSSVTMGGKRDMDDKPVDRPDKGTVAVRQGTGPRAMVTVLLISTLAALAAMLIIYLYFFAGPTSPPRA
jgi:hypothetical protein